VEKRKRVRVIFGVKGIKGESKRRVSYAGVGLKSWPWTCSTGISSLSETKRRKRLREWKASKYALMKVGEGSRGSRSCAYVRNMEKKT
jgi:hypothetical protein